MKIGLLGKMLLSILTPAIAGLLLVAGVSYKISESNLREQIINDAKALLRCQSIGLHAMLTVMEESLSMVAADNRIILYLDAVNDKMPEVMTRTLFNDADAALNTFVTLNSNFEFCGVAGRDGIAIAHHLAGEKHPSKSVGVSFTDRSYYQRAMQGQKTITGVISKTTGKIATIIGLPIMRNGKPEGLVWAGIDNENLAQTTTSQIDFGTKGGIYAYDTKGIMMLNRDLKAFGRDDSKKPYVAEILKNPEGLVRFTGEDGGNKTVFYRAMPGIGWILCLEVDRDEIYTPMRIMLGNSMMLTFASALVVGLIIFFAARAIARLLRSISGIAESVAEGRLEALQKKPCSLPQKNAVMNSARWHLAWNTWSAISKRCCKKVNRKPETPSRQRKKPGLPPHVRRNPPKGQKMPSGKACSLQRDNWKKWSPSFLLPQASFPGRLSNRTR